MAEIKTGTLRMSTDGRSVYIPDQCQKSEAPEQVKRIRVRLAEIVKLLQAIEGLDFDGDLPPAELCCRFCDRRFYFGEAYQRAFYNRIITHAEVISEMALEGLKTVGK